MSTIYLAILALLIQFSSATCAITNFPTASTATVTSGADVDDVAVGPATGSIDLSGLNCLTGTSSAGYQKLSFSSNSASLSKANVCSLRTKSSASKATYTAVAKVFFYSAGMFRNFHSSNSIKSTSEMDDLIPASVTTYYGAYFDHIWLYALSDGGSLNPSSNVGALHCYDALSFSTPCALGLISKDIYMN